LSIFQARYLTEESHHGSHRGGLKAFINSLVPESDEFSGGKLNIRRIEKSPKALLKSF